MVLSDVNHLSGRRESYKKVNHVNRQSSVERGHLKQFESDVAPAVEEDKESLAAGSNLGEHQRVQTDNAAGKVDGLVRRQPPVREEGVKQESLSYAT